MAAKEVTLSPEEIDALEVTYLGPSWQTNDDGSWHLPERTLGWEIIGWCSRYLRNPDTGGPWEFTLEQMRIILWWYAIDEHGNFIYNSGVIQRLKGWGKDPLLAVVCLVEFVGPCRFGGWDDSGEPIVAPQSAAWVQVAAVSKEQTKNTIALFPSLMTDDLRSDYGIKAGDAYQILRAHQGRNRLEPVTSNYRSLEGGRSTFVLMNETHHWVSSNSGHDMANTIDGNTTKGRGRGARALAITNAYQPGEDSVAERMRVAYEEILAGRAMDVGVMYDTIEAHPSTPLTPEALEIVIPKIRGDAVWLSVKGIISSVMNTRIALSRSRRMWLNQIVSSDEALITKQDWANSKDVDLTLEPGDAITLGFDGAKTRDSTALVAMRIKDRATFVIGLWERPHGPEAEGWEVERNVVDHAVRDAIRVYDVQGFYADVAYWESYIHDWGVEFGDQFSIAPHGDSPVAWDMRKSVKEVTRANERLVQAVMDGKIKHDGDLNLTRHVMSVRRHENRHGVSFTKDEREGRSRIDLYAAMLLAHEALLDMGKRGKAPKRQRTGKGWFM